MATHSVIQLSRRHFGATEALDEQARGDLAHHGSVASQRPRGMLCGLLERSLRDGLLLGLGGAKPDSVNAYLAATVMDDYLHIEEIAVEVALRRQGRGMALLRAVKAECVRRSFKAITLTTDRFLPFNAGFFKAQGFEAIKPSASPAHLQVLQRVEHKVFRDPSRRIAMIWGPMSL